MISGCTNDIPQVVISSSQAKKALDIALNQQDKLYEWAGNGPNKFDCSGLIVWSYKRALGKNDIFRINSEQITDVTMEDLYYWNVSRIPLKKIRSGDIIFITREKGKITHGGLFVEWVDENTFKFINASSYYNRVVVDVWSIDEIKRGQWFVGAGRFKISY